MAVTMAIAGPESTEAAPDELALVIERAKSGDLAAFEDLVRRHERLVLGTALRLVRGNREDAQDAAQQVFLRVHKYLARFDGRQPFTHWLYRVVVNVCHDLNRRRVEMVPLDDQRAEQSGAEKAVAEREQRELLARALRTLPEKERAALVLRDLRGLETHEVAKILGSSEATVRSQISAARVKLRAWMKKELS